MRSTVKVALALLLLAGDLLAQRAIIPPTTAPGRYPLAGVTVNVTDADVVVLNRFLFTGDGHEAVLVFNDDDTVTRNVSIVSVADPSLGSRTGDIVGEAILPNTFRVFGPFAGTGWRQPSDGYIWCEANSVNVTFAVIKLP